MFGCIKLASFFWHDSGKLRKMVVLYMYAIGIAFAYFCDFSIRFWNSSNNVVYFHFIAYIGGIALRVQQYFSYIVVVAFIGEGNRIPRSTRRKPPTCHKLSKEYR
jgi:hypothetical protein